MKYSKIQRITENVYDVILETKFYDEAKRQLKRDLNNHNISVDKSIRLITIENLAGTKILYKIQFSKAQ